MRHNPVKDKLKAGKPVYGTWISGIDLIAARVLARMGFDWLTIDMEHSPIDMHHAATMIATIADSGCVPLVRVPSGSHDHIKRALDAGAWGIVVPMVDSREQAISAVDAAKYPPEGNRSLGGSLHALSFATDPNTYFRRANEEILVILQTESSLGIDHADEIYGLPGIDAIFVGPVDLRARLSDAEGNPATDESFELALESVIQAGRRHNVPTGMHVMNAEAALQRSSQGMQFIAIGSEIRFMVDSVKRVLEKLHPNSVPQDVMRY